MGFAMCMALFTSVALADELSVPVELQVELLDRIVRYERTFASESTPVRVLVVSRANSPESVRVSAQLIARLRHTGRLGGRPTTSQATRFAGASALAAEVRASTARIVYLAPGLGGDASAIAAALAGLGVITVSSVGADVDRGVVLGFELVSARPRVAVHLGAARAQHLQFNAQFLRLARVVR